MFIDVLNNLCEENHKSPYKVCEEIGLNRSAVAKWKKGATPQGTTLNKIADYFGVSVDYLLGNEQEEKPSGKAEEPDITFNDFTYALHNETKELTEENKQKLLEMARFFKEQQDKEKDR